MPENVIGFLLAHVEDRAKLDLVLYLQRIGKAVPVWIAASELCLSKQHIRAMGRDLASRGLVCADDDKLELAPHSVKDRHAIIDLATWCLLDRTRVLHVLRCLGRN